MRDEPLMLHLWLERHGDAAGDAVLETNDPSDKEGHPSDLVGCPTIQHKPCIQHMAGADVEPNLIVSP